MSVSLFHFYFFYFFDFIPSNNVIMLIPCFSWDFYGIRIWVETTHTHMHTTKLSLYLFHSSSRFVLFLLDFSLLSLYSVLLCRVVCFVARFNFSSLSIRFTQFFDWDIRMRIVSIPFHLIFACFQNKVLSCLIRRQSFVSSYLPANQLFIRSIQLTQIKLAIWLTEKKRSFPPPHSDPSSSAADACLALFIIWISLFLFHSFTLCVPRKSFKSANGKVKARVAC